MAVVKKYSSGNKITEDFISYFDRTLGDKIAKKSLSAFQQALDEKWGKLSALDEESQANIFKNKAIANTYEVSLDALPEELRGYDWEGTEKPIKKVLGKYIATDPREINSLIAASYNEWRKQHRPNTPTKQDKNIADIKDYIKLVKFGGEDMFSELIDPLEDSQKQEYLRDAAKENLLRYANEYNKSPNEYNYRNIDKVQKLINDFDNLDFDQLKSRGAELGWNLGEFFPAKPVVDKEEEARLAKEKADAAKLAADEKAFADTVESFRKAQIDPQTAQELAQNKFRIITDYDPGKIQLPEYLNKHGYTVVQDPYGNTKMFQKGQLAQDPVYFGLDDPKRYGDYWTVNSAGNVDYFYPGSEGHTGYDSQLAGRYGARKIGTSKPFGNNIYGYPTLKSDGSYLTDRVGNIDYTKNLIYQDPDTGAERPVVYDEFSGSYKWGDDSTDKLTVPSFTHYTEDIPYDYSLAGGPDELSRITGSNILEDFSKNIYKIKNILDQPEFANLKEWNRGGYGNPDSWTDLITATEAGKKDVQTSAQIVSTLAFIIQNPTKFKPVEVNKAKKMYKEIWQSNGGFIPNDAATPIYNYVTGKWVYSKKEGGVLKLQSGDKTMSPADYLTTLGKTPVPHSASGGRDIRGTVKDMNALDVISLGSSAVSMAPVPVVAGIAGTVTLLADIANDIADDDKKIQWAKHLANLGFAGLGFVGFGGVRGFKLVADAAKVGDKFVDAGKLIKQAKSLRKMGRPEFTNVAISADKLVDALKTKVVKAEDFTSIVNKLGKGEDLVGSELKILQKANIGTEELKNVIAAQTINSPKLGVLFSKTINAVSKPLGSKAVKIATPIVGAGIAGKGLLEVGKNVAEAGSLKEGLENTDVNTFKEILMGTSLGAQSLRGFRDAKAFKTFTTTTKVNEPTLSIKGTNKSYPVSKEITFPKKGLTEKAENYSKRIDSFKETLLKDEKLAKNKEAIEELVNAAKSKKTILFNKNEFSTAKLAFNEEEVLSNPKDFVRAQKVIGRDFNSSMVYRKPNIEIIPKVKATPKATIEKTILETPATSVVTSPEVPETVAKINIEKGNKTVEKLKGRTKKLPVESKKVVTPENNKLKIVFNNKGESNKNPLEVIYRKPVTRKRGRPPGSKSKVPTKQIGGILKLQTGKTVENILEETNVTAEGNKNLFKKKESIPWVVSGTPPPSLNYIKIPPKQPTPEQLQQGTEAFNAVEAEKLYGVEVGNLPNINQKPFDWTNIAKYVSPESIGNILNYVGALHTNKKIADLKAESLIKSIYRPMTMPRQFYRTSSIADLPYRQAAANTISQGRRMMESSSNFMPGIGLEAMGIANKYETEGAMAKASDLTKQRGTQEASDVYRMQYNIPLVNKYGQMVANIDAQLPLVKAGKLAANYGATSNFLTAGAKNVSSQIGKALSYDMAKLLDSDEYKDYSERRDNIFNEEAKLKEAWETKKATDPSNLYLQNQKWGPGVPEWEDWNKDYEAIKKEGEEFLKKYKNLERLQSFYPPQYPYYRKGGGTLTLSEREYMENLKHYNKTKLLNIKEFYKSILENNKLIQKTIAELYK